MSSSETKIAHKRQLIAAAVKIRNRKELEAKLASRKKTAPPKKVKPKTKPNNLSLKNSLMEGDSVVQNQSILTAGKLTSSNNNFIKNLEEASFITKIPDTNTLVLHLPKNVRDLVLIEKKALDSFLRRMSELIERFNELPKIILEERANERVRVRLENSLKDLTILLQDWAENLEDE